MIHQPSFDLGNEELAPVEAVPAVEGEQDDRRPQTPVKVAPVVPEVERRLVEQVRRDTAVLREDPMYHVPSAEFYEERIASCRRMLLEGRRT